MVDMICVNCYSNWNFLNMLCFRRQKDPAEIQEALLEKERQRISKQIEKDLKADEKLRQGQYRILLLGCGEAGKSTFIKQMRIIHSDGFSTQERMDTKSDIANNILSGIQTLLQNTSGQWSDESMEEKAKLIESLPEVMSPLDLHQYTPVIKTLWESDEVQVAFSHRSKFQLVESAKYFLSRADLVLQPDYLPTNQDIVQTRVKTTGIIEHDFDLIEKHRKKKLILIDVGGQRSERKKWIHCFQDVLLILFLTAVSEYDQVLAENHDVNRMQESLRLFATILSYKWFKETSFILFLNKADLLKEKIQKVPLQLHFEDFLGPEKDEEAALTYFEQKFNEMNRHKERKIYTHRTCATDTDNIKIVDVVLRKIILDTLLTYAMIN